MDNYTKGENFEHEKTRDQIPILGLPENCKWMKIKGGTKLRNVIGMTEKGLKEDGCVIISGSGAALNQVVSLAEIVKRS